MINQDSGFIDVQWTDAGAAGLDVTSFGAPDVTISGVTVDSFENRGGGLVRYHYADGDDDELPPGTVQVTLVAAAVADRAGNLSAQVVQSFVFNTAPTIQNTDLTLSVTSVAANSPVSLSGVVTDPDPSQPHSIVIDWGDGSTAETLSLAGGVLSFGPIFHTYADDNPTGTAADPYTITVTVSDGLASAVAQASLTVTNVSPVASAGPDQTVAEGGQATFHSTFSDPDPLDTHTFAWSVAADNGQVVPGGSDQSFSFVPANDGTYLVTFTVTDDDGGTSADTASVIVTNVAPAATFAVTADVAEGATGEVQFSAQDDPSPIDAAAGFTYSYDFDNDGVFDDTASPIATAIVPATYLADGPAVRVVRGRIEDHDGGFTDYLAEIIIRNVAPTLTVSGADVTGEGAAYVLNLSASDPGQDTIVAWTIDWGDGVVEQVPGNVTSAAHVYADGPGSHAIRAAATDEDGTFSASGLAVTVSNVSPVITGLTSNSPECCGVARAAR